MTDEITKNMSDSEKLDFIINAVSDTNRRMTMLEERQTALEERMTAMEERMTAMETLVHNRLQDTRPIWQAVLEQLQKQQEQLDAQQEQLVQLHEGQRRIEQKLTFIHQDYVELRTDVGLLSKRVTTLENLRQAA